MVDVVWTGAGWVPAGSVAATNFQATRPRQQPAQSGWVPIEQVVGPQPQPAPSSSWVPIEQVMTQPATSIRQPTTSWINAPSNLPQPQTVTISPQLAGEAPSRTFEDDARRLSSTVAGSMNRQYGGAEVIRTIDQGGGVSLLELNPDIPQNPTIASELARELQQDSKTYSRATYTKVNDFEYRISPKSVIATPIATSDTSGSSAHAKAVFSQMFSPSSSTTTTDTTQYFSTGPQTMGTLLNQEIQNTNELYQRAGIPIHISQMTLQPGEAASLGYSRAAIKMNQQIADINDFNQKAGIPTHLESLPLNTDTTPTGFAGFVQKLDIAAENAPILGGIVRGGQSFREQNQPAKNPFAKSGIIQGAAYNFGEAGAESIITFPEFAVKTGIRTIGAGAYALSGRSETGNPIGDVGSFYGEQGWTMAVLAGLGIMSAGLSASQGNVQAITDPLARLAGGAFVLGQLLNPKFTADETVWVPPGKVMVDTTGKVSISKGGWEVLPTEAQKAEAMAKMGSETPTLTEAQKADIFSEIDKSWEAGRSLRLQGSMTTGGGDSGISDAFSASATKAFGGPKQWLYDKIVSRLETNPLTAAQYGPDMTIEPIMGPTSQLVLTRGGEYAVTATPSGGTFLGQPQYVATVSLAPPTVIGTTSSLASNIAIGSLSAGTLWRGGQTAGTLQPTGSVTSSWQPIAQATSLFQPSISSQLQTQNTLQTQIQINPTITRQAQITPTLTTQFQIQNQLQTRVQLQTQSQLQQQVQSQLQLQRQVQVTPKIVPPILGQAKPIEKKRGSFRLPSMPKLRVNAKSSIRSDLISSDISKIRYGKATSPKPSPSLYSRFAVGGVIPTVEMRKGKGKPGFVGNLKRMFKRGKL